MPCVRWTGLTAVHGREVEGRHLAAEAEQAADGERGGAVVEDADVCSLSARFDLQMNELCMHDTDFF